MCPPLFAAIGVGIASAASAVSSVGLGTIVSLAGTGLSAYGAIQQGQAQKASSDAQAAAYRQQAVQTVKQGQFQGDMQKEKDNQAAGTQSAMVAGSGVTFAGSPMDAFASNASTNELNRGMTLHNATAQAQTLNYQARLATISGRNSQTAGIIGGVSELFGGLAKVGTYVGQPYGGGTGNRNFSGQTPSN
jgi:hypothetical protein